MSYEIIFSSQARRDLEEVFSYISNELLSFENAVKQVSKLHKAIRTLTELPERFRKIEFSNLTDYEIRIMSVGHYLIFYHVDKFNQMVTILHVVYEAKNYERLFK